MTENNSTDERSKIVKASKTARMLSVMFFFIGGFSVAVTIYYNVTVNEGMMTLFSLISAVLIGIIWHRGSVFNRMSRDVLKFETVEDYVSFVEKDIDKD